SPRGKPQIAQIPHVRCVRHPDELDRPQGDVVARPILARRVFAGAQSPSQYRPSRNKEAVVQTALLWVGSQLDDRHRGRGPQVVGIEDVEQLLGEPGEFGIDLELYPGRQERKALEQSLDIR